MKRQDRANRCSVARPKRMPVYRCLLSVGCEIVACQVPNGRPNRGTGTPKNIWTAKQKVPDQVKIFLDCQNKLKFY